MCKFSETKVFLCNFIENIVGKEEIAHTEQFLLFPQYFQKSSAVQAGKVVCNRERVIQVVCFHKAFTSYGMTPAKWVKFGTSGKLASGEITSCLEQFYMTCPISRASETMAECLRASKNDASLMAAE